MTRDEFSDQLQALVSHAYEEKLPMLHLWSVLSEQFKLVELMLDMEIVTQYKKARDEKND
jgi:hypothetical protein